MFVSTGHLRPLHDSPKSSDHRQSETTAKRVADMALHIRQRTRRRPDRRPLYRVLWKHVTTLWCVLRSFLEAALHTPREFVNSLHTHGRVHVELTPLDKEASQIICQSVPWSSCAVINPDQRESHSECALTVVGSIPEFVCVHAAKTNTLQINSS